MNSSEDRWAKFHEKALSYEEAISQEPFKTLIEVIGSYAKDHQIESLLETGFGTGYVLIELNKRLNLLAIGLEQSNTLLYKATALSIDKGINVAFAKGDMFNANEYPSQNKDIRSVIYHQGLLEHFSNAKIRELLKLQIENSFAVIFSVPSFFYGRQDFGDERLLTIEQWQEILTPFDFFKLEYYDDKKHILGIMKGDFYE